ncbi:DUF167 domain-containing protein [Sphingomonas sp. GCM10030256]|uniref:DUF167 domain-containing protein n=1 Tax=Sphingomonas sp. GCM10030256 TaxID=3273427 RepID=UPI00362142D8
MAKRKLPLPDASEVRKRMDANGLIEIRVTPNASVEAVTLPEGDNKVLSIRTTATPEHGKANEAVLSLLARALGLPVSSLALVRGATSKNKLVRIV